MQPATSTTYQADEQFAQHLLDLGFTDTTGSAYHRARGWRSFYHVERYLSVWLMPGRITVQAGEHWCFEVNGPVQAEALNLLLTTRLAASQPTPSHLNACPHARAKQC